MIFHYLPRHSFLHGVPPQWKLLGYLILSFAAASGPPWVLFLLSSIVLALHGVGKVSLLLSLRSGKPLWILACFLFLFRSLSKGLESGATETFRFLLMILLANLYMAIATASAIRKGIEFYVSLLFPARAKRLGLALGITLLLVPLLLDLAREIREAASLRGFESKRGIRRFIQRFAGTYLRKAFRMASTLSQSLELRGFE